MELVRGFKVDSATPITCEYQHQMTSEILTKITQILVVEFLSHQIL